MTLARIFVICIGLLLFYLMFLKSDNLLFKFMADMAAGFGSLAARILTILRALLSGYCAYALTALLLSFSRIETFGDIWTLLRTRPSRLGGAGVLGVLAGILFACWAYARTDQESLLQSWFIRGRQMGQPQDPNSSNSLDRAAKIRDLNKKDNRGK